MINSLLFPNVFRNSKLFAVFLLQVGLKEPINICQNDMFSMEVSNGRVF